MNPTMVETTAGRVEGRDDGDLRVFRGIPFARPPVGPLRFRPPQPAEPWTGVRDARHAGPIAPQNPSPLEQLFAANRPPMDEDCLSLNVWTPGPDDGARPVLVWIHGGAFVTGSGATPWYDGTSFARRHDLVVVTINYRLGALGFLHLADLGGEAYASSGNVGMLDQVAALTWVRDNVAAFGGDPDNVTIFGESAGAMSVGTLMGMPAASGLFRRAVPQSGAASNAAERERATKVATEVLAALGLEPTTAGLTELHDVPVERLLDAQAQVVLRHAPSRIALSPVVDGTALPEPPLDAIASGSAAGVDLLTGTNLDETKLFIALDPSASSIDETALMAQADEIFGPGAGSTAVEAYRTARPDATLADVGAALTSDRIFRVPAVRLAERQSAHTDRTYMYLFTWATPSFGGRLGSCHALEIPFVFNVLDNPGVELFTGPVSGQTAELALAMHDAWAAFARIGDPDHAGLPHWPRYAPDDRATMLLGEQRAVELDPYGDELRLWP